MVIDFYYQDEPYIKGDLLVEFTLSTVMPDNRLKKVKAWGKGLANSNEYEKWKKLSELELISQGYARKNKDELYNGVVIAQIYFSPKQNKNGYPSNKVADKANLNKAIYDLIQYRDKKGYGFFLQDDKQIMRPEVINWKSTSTGMMMIRIYKAKKL